jgi:hypothetical protein
MKAILGFFCIFSLIQGSAIAQHDYNWVFDSLLVTFDAYGVVAKGSSMGGHLTTETSYSDSQGGLILYSRGNHGSGLYNSNHLIVPNSSGFKFYRQSQSIVFLPFVLSGQISIISKDPPTTSQGCDVWHHVYRIVSDSLVHKDQSLLPLGIGFKMATGATRHANGRDWWVVNHESVGRKFYITLVTEQGFEPPLVQEIGSKHGFDTPRGNGGGYGGSLLFTKNGEKLIVTSGEGIIEEFSFDRCTGLLTFVRTIHPGVLDFSRVLYWATLSPNSNILYVSNSNLENDTYQIEQFDLTSNNPWSTRYEVVNMGSGYGAGSVQAGPDGRVYFMAGYWGTGTGLYDTNHMQVIHQPNVMGPGCQFQPNGISLPLTTDEISYTLPYFINYNLKAKANTVCDSLGIGYSSDKESLPERLRAYPNPGKDYCKLELPPDFSGEITQLIGRDLQGKEVNLSWSVETDGHIRVNTQSLSPGLYTLELRSGRQYYQVYWSKSDE